MYPERTALSTSTKNFEDLANEQLGSAVEIDKTIQIGKHRLIVTLGKTKNTFFIQVRNEEDAGVQLDDLVENHNYASITFEAGVDEAVYYEGEAFLNTFLNVQTPELKGEKQAHTAARILLSLMHETTDSNKKTDAYPVVRDSVPEEENPELPIEIQLRRESTNTTIGAVRSAGDKY